MGGDAPEVMVVFLIAAGSIVSSAAAATILFPNFFRRIRRADNERLRPRLSEARRNRRSGRLPVRTGTGGRDGRVVGGGSGEPRSTAPDVHRSNDEAPDELLRAANAHRTRGHSCRGGSCVPTTSAGLSGKRCRDRLSSEFGSTSPSAGKAVVWPSDTSRRISRDSRAGRWLRRHCSDERRVCAVVGRKPKHGDNFLRASRARSMPSRLERDSRNSVTRSDCSRREETRVPRGLTQIVASLFILLSAAHAAAQPRVQVRVAGINEVGPFANEVRQLVSDLDVAVTVTGIERVLVDEVVAIQPRSLLAAAWLRFETASSALYLSDPLGERILIREVDAGGREVVREQLLQILRASLEALLLGQIVGDPRQEVETSLRSATVQGASERTISTDGESEDPEPDESEREAESSDIPAIGDRTEDEPLEGTDRPAESRAWFAGALGYGGRWIGSDVWTHGPRLAFEAGIAFGGWIVAGYAGGRYTVPVSISRQPVGATLQGGAMEIGARIRRRLGLWELGLGVGPFVEWLSAEGSTASDSGLQATPAPLQTLVAIATEGLIGLRIAHQFAIEVRAGVETEIKGATFAYRESGADREVFSPAIVRSRASVGLRLDW